MPKSLIANSNYLLAYSPVAFGILSGKYRGEELPKIAAIFPRMAHYSEESLQATELYASIADKHGLSFGTNVFGFCCRSTLCDF